MQFLTWILYFCFKVQLFKVKLSPVLCLYNTKGKNFMNVCLIIGLLGRYLLCFLLNFLCQLDQSGGTDILAQR